MRNSLHQTITCELQDIVKRHMGDLRPYLSLPDGGAAATDDILAHLQRLAEVCARSPGRSASPELYHEVLEAQATIEAFLKVMNQAVNVDFSETEVGHILNQAQVWRRALTAAGAGVTTFEIWDLIAPVKPDHLFEVETGLYEAQWWKPVPWMDVEILRRTEGVVIQHEECDPKRLPGGLLVRFSVTPS